MMTILIMMIDITEATENSLLGSYADDTKLWQIVHMHVKLQQDLIRLSKWIKKWKKIVFFCTTIYNNKVVGDCRSMIYTVFVSKLMYKCMYNK